jgi:hypothetical protein
MFDHAPFPCYGCCKSPDGGRFQWIGSEIAVATDDPCAADVVGVGDRLADAAVREIILIHGTFAGGDIAGMIRPLTPYSPRMSRLLKELSKQWLDQLVDEVGNYTAGYARRLAGMISDGRPDPIPVSRFHWSGENHHLGRACAAASLLDQLFRRDWKPAERLLLWAHSHAGNILAMMSLVLGCDRDTKRAFLDIIGVHLDAASAGQTSTSISSRLRGNLLDPQRVSALPKMDVVTFGTPLRYRWNPDFTKHLMHFVQHRPLNPYQPSFATLPTSFQDIQQAAGGDYIQQLGVGGTDFSPPPWYWKSWKADRRLKKMFESTVRRRDLKKYLMRGQRVALDGQTMLVDYASTAEAWNQKLLGHGVYTCSPWLPFHLRQITKAFYA